MIEPPMNSGSSPNSELSEPYGLRAASPRSLAVCPLTRQQLKLQTTQQLSEPASGSIPSTRRLHSSSDSTPKCVTEWTKSGGKTKESR
jgi:hypothetical protein